MFEHYLPAEDVCRHTLDLQRERTYPIALCWRADSFRETAGRPMTMRRAAALNAVLERCELMLLPGSLLLGPGCGNATEGDIPALHDAVSVLSEIGRRSFTTHFDHHAPDYPRLLQRGLLGLVAEIQASLAEHEDPERRTFLFSMLQALEGVSRYIMRWAEAATIAAAQHPTWSALLQMQAAMMRHLARNAPRTFHEALQLVYTVHNVFQLDERNAMALGRLDQYLYPFYHADLEAGQLTIEGAQALLDHFFAKLAHLGDIQNITIGGVTPDGHDATNPLSFMCLEAAQRIARPGGNVTARIHADTPDAFLRKCAEVIRTGIGFPAVYNDAVEIPALVDQGYPLEEARDYCFVGCIEAFIPGRQAPWADSRFNLLRCVTLALWDGLDTVTGTQCGPHTGEPQTWPDFFEAFLTHLRHGLHAHIDHLHAAKTTADHSADQLTSPLMSALVADCIARGLDVNMDGARYPANHGVAGMGIGSAADALMVIKRFVYDQQRFSLHELRNVLTANFDGYATERRLFMHDAPKYGNDDPEVDAIAVDGARAFAEACLRYRTPRGGRYWALMAANVQNIAAGREVGATPDGRLAFEPLSDAASPAFGRDTHGPTAVIRSIAKLDYRLAPGGNVVNMKFHPSALAGDEGLAALAALIRTCFILGGAQLQFNTTDREVLKQAMAHPEAYRDLVVRVSGFSAHFVGLDRAVQEDILARTEHQGL